MQKLVDLVHAPWTTASGRCTGDPHGSVDGKSPKNGRGGDPACRCSPVAAGKGNSGVRNSPRGSPKLGERRGDEGEVVAVVGLDRSVLWCEGEGERGGDGC
jgi:hypothetical protein